MGLDSVELLVSVEQEFGIKIPDTECQRIYTVQDFIDSVYKRISINPTKKCLTQIVFYRIKQAVLQLDLSDTEVCPETRIEELLTEVDLVENWEKMEAILDLRLPKLVASDLDRSLNSHFKFMGLQIFRRTRPVTKGTLRELIGWIISLNFDKTLDIHKVLDEYVIERIICGIISDKIGIPIHEIDVKHSLTRDLGIE